MKLREAPSRYAFSAVDAGAGPARTGARARNVPSVLLVEGMPAHAMCFASVAAGYGISPHNVLTSTASAEMVGVKAFRVVTEMVDLEAERYLANREGIREPMRQNKLPLPSNKPVPVPGSTPVPAFKFGMGFASNSQSVAEVHSVGEHTRKYTESGVGLQV